jgi:hypothetical protein
MRASLESQNVVLLAIAYFQGIGGGLADGARRLIDDPQHGDIVAGGQREAQVRQHIVELARW